MKDLATRLRPLVNAFARQLTELVQARIDAVIVDAETAIESALSAIVADLEPAAAESPRKQSISERRRVHGLAEVPADERSENVATIIAAPVSRVAKPTPVHVAKVSGKVTCKRCGFVGGNARGCGTAHETLVADNEDDEPEVRVAEPPLMSKRDRFALIEAKAAARTNAGLPVPRASFEVEDGQVRELEAVR
jgi:dihydroorotase-like cyclic amidohydrolase